MKIMISEAKSIERALRYSLEMKRKRNEKIIVSSVSAHMWITVSSPLVPSSLSFSLIVFPLFPNLRLASPV